MDGNILWNPKINHKWFCPKAALWTPNTTHGTILRRFPCRTRANAFLHVLKGAHSIVSIMTLKPRLKFVWFSFTNVNVVYILVTRQVLSWVFVVQNHNYKWKKHQHNLDKKVCQVECPNSNLKVIRAWPPIGHQVRCNGMVTFLA